MPDPTAVRIAALGLLCLTLACKEEREPAPRVPTSGGNSTSQGPRDASTGDAARPVADSGRDDDGGGVFPLDFECSQFKVAASAGESPSTGRYLNAVDEPPDFKVTRGLATWDITCTPPTIVLALSTGDCPEGAGHELEFALDATAIQAGVISPGQNAIESESIGKTLRVRYVRPRGLSPSGVWGTCAEVPPTGGVTIRDERLGVGYGARFEALFQMTLSPCDVSANPAIQVEGSFDLQLRRSIDEVCPAD